MRIMQELRENKAFHRQAMVIIMPVLFQQLIVSLFSFLDSYMVGLLGASAMTGVAVANKPYTVFTCVYFGLVGASGMMIAQYYGAKDERTTQQLFGLQVLGGLAVGAVFFAVLALFPESIIRAFVSDEATIRAGLNYLSIIKYSYLPLAVSQAVNYALRVLGKNRFVMIVGFSATLVNLCLNSVLIFGLLGFPQMGERGAALATLIARTAEMFIYLWVLSRHKTPFTLHLFCARRLPRPVFRTFWQKSLPLMLTSALSTVATMITYWSYSHVQEYALPAVSIMEQVFVIICVLEAGLAPPPIIGITLGTGRMEEAKKQAKSLLWLSLLLGLTGFVLGCVLAAVIPALYVHLDVQLRRMARQMILLQAVLFIPKALYTTCYAILRAGGDMRSFSLLEAGYTWFAVVPASLLCAFLLPALGLADVRIVVAAVQVITYARTVPAIFILLRGRWAQNMTIVNQRSCTD